MSLALVAYEQARHACNRKDAGEDHAELVEVPQGRHANKAFFTANGK
jgi:hypothetical protein